MTVEQHPIAAAITSRGVTRRWFGNRFAIGIAAVGMVLFAYVAWHFKTTGQPPFLHRESVWSIAIYEGATPFDLAPIDPSNSPVLTAQDVDDVPALFVADPFMVSAAGQHFMFLEVLNLTTRQGDIGLATSTDGLHWQYDELVLDEPFHLSYPSVFAWEDEWYMLPEAGASGEVRLYVADQFPKRWRLAKTLIREPDLADPTIFRHADTWWMFVGVGHTHDTLRLFYADDLLGPWTEHPRSPLVERDADNARPGGPVVQYEGSLYRFVQDCAPKYGNQLNCFKITKLTKTEFADEPVGDQPILKASGHGWNAVGMHHNDPHPMPDGSWRAVVDGHTKTWHLHSTP